MKYVSVLCLCCPIAVFIYSFKTLQQVPDGKKLFQQCVPCHGLTKAFTGPPLQQVRRYYSVPQITTFLHNPPKFIAANREMQVTYRYYDRYMHTAHPFIKEAEVKAILDYVDLFK